jgi:hypothetical protein
MTVRPRSPRGSSANPYLNGCRLHRRRRCGEFSRNSFDGGQLRRKLFSGDFGVIVGLHVDEEHVSQPECDKRRAVSALIPRLPCTISLIRRGGTSIALAIRYCEIPIGKQVVWLMRELADGMESGELWEEQ